MNTILFTNLAAEPGSGLIALAILAVAAVILIVSNIHVVPQARAYVVERLGTYSKTWKNGIHVKIPFVQRVKGTPRSLWQRDVSSP